MLWRVEERKRISDGMGYRGGAGFVGAALIVTKGVRYAVLVIVVAFGKARIFLKTRRGIHPSISIVSRLNFHGRLERCSRKSKFIKKTANLTMRIQKDDLLRDDKSLDDIT